MKFEFVEEKRNSYNARIKVIGVGGGGNNTINEMWPKHLHVVTMP